MLPKDDKNKPIVDAPDMVNKLKTNSHQMAVKINEFASKMQEEVSSLIIIIKWIKSKRH